MARPRPRRALRPALRLTIARAAGPVLALSVVGGVLAAGLAPAPSASVAVPPPTSTPVADASTDARTSRDLTRPPLTLTPSATASDGGADAAAGSSAAFAVSASTRVVGTRYAKSALKARSQPRTTAGVASVIAAGSRVSVTSGDFDGWTSVLVAGKGRWVRSTYLSTKQPAAAGGISTAACAGGSAVESGLTRDAIRVHRAICARFPQVSAYGGVRADSLPEHPSGRALDAMISDSAVGWQIANWVRANAKRLGVSQVLYAQHIWTVQRSSEGWRTFADRGSATANHDDHVHVTVYGNAGNG